MKQQGLQSRWWGCFSWLNIAIVAYYCPAIQLYDVAPFAHSPCNCVNFFVKMNKIRKRPRDVNRKIVKRIHSGCSKSSLIRMLQKQAKTNQHKHNHLYNDTFYILNKRTNSQVLSKKDKLFIYQLQSTPLPHKVFLPVIHSAPPF